MSAIMVESEVQDLVSENKRVQGYIKNILNIEGDIQFIPEDTYINGITPDFTLVQDNTIKAIIECKSGDIGVTDYVRGIGQLLQYEYFGEEKIPHKSYDYEPYENFKTVYLFPSSVIKNNDFNIERFKYPETTLILELNENNHAIRHVDDEELNRLQKSKTEENLVAISPYYFRDNRVFEYYILLDYLRFVEHLGIKKIDRTETEKTFLRKIGSINNKNWRNAFITLKNLGLINKDNLLTRMGKEVIMDSYEEFAVWLFRSYLEPYFYEFIKCFNNQNQVKMNNPKFCECIREKYGGKDVLYLTQSDNRYISSFLSMMRDDYGIIDFRPRQQLKTLNYNPSELNDTGLKNKVVENSVGYKYIEKYRNILKSEY